MAAGVERETADVWSDGACGLTLVMCLSWLAVGSSSSLSHLPGL